MNLRFSLRPNKRLKLTGPAFRGEQTFVHQRADTAGRDACARGRSPRSLGAIR